MRLSVLALFLPAVLAAQGIPAVSRNTAGAPPAAQPAAPPTKPEDLCKLSGRVLNAVTGEPVRRTTIMLMRADPTPGEPPLAYTTASNAEGQFTMKDVEPGRYRLTATRNGFVNLIYGARGPMRPGTTLSLARQQNLTDLDLKMTPHAVITGRIVDEDGEPLANVPLVLQSYRYVQGRKQLATAGGGTSTNDLGEYRMFGIAPGKYLLSAAAVNRAPNFAVDRSAVAGPEEDYVSTYYPGTIDPAGATQIDVAPGAQLRGMNMTLSKAHTVRVKGRVTHGLPGRPNITVFIASRNNTFMMGGMRNTRVDPAGTFEIHGVTPGAYTLTAMVNDAQGSHQGRVAVDVGTSTVEGVNIVVGPAIAVKGRIRAESDAAPVDLTTIRITLQQHDPGMMFGGAGAAPPDDQGNFEIRNAAPDRFNVVLINLPAGAYLKSARSDQVDVLASGLDLSSGAPPAPLDIVISPRGATVTGTVQNEKTGNPAPGATVVLIPQDNERRDQPYYTRNITADQHGAFSLAGLPPGDYKLYAWEDVELGAWSDPDFMKAFDGKGEAVTLGEGDQKPLPLKLIPADASLP